MTTRFPRDTVHRLIRLLLAACVLALVASAVLNHLQYAELDDAIDRARQSRQTITAVDGVGRALFDADAGVRDYLLTRETSALGGYLENVGAAERMLNDLERQVDGGPDQRSSLRRLQALGAQQLALLARAASLQGGQADAAALQTIRNPEARQLSSDIRAVLKTMVGREEALLAERAAAAQAKRDLTKTLSWATEIGAALVLLGGSIFARRTGQGRLAVSEALHASRLELEASERRVRAMANALPALIGYVDETETYRFVNTRYESFFDAPPGSFVGKTVRDILGARVYAATKGRIAAALAGTPQTFERCDRQDGRDAHLLLHYVPDRDAAERVIGFYVMALDITDRKSAEMAQQVNERRLRAITDQVPAIIAHLDRDHRYLYANEGFRRLWGVDPAQLIGRTQRDFRGEFVYAQIAEHLLGVLGGETRRFEVREVIGGIERHLQQSLVPDHAADGSVQGYYSVSFDITDLRRNEALVLESSARHRSIVEEQSELVSLARPDGELSYVNPAYACHFGSEPAALVGTNLYDLVEPSDRDRVRAAVARVLETGTVQACENRLVGTDGRERWVAWTNTLQRDAYGTTTLRSVGRDITEQRRAEHALRASEAFLDRTGRMAGVGGYELDLARGTLFWSDEVRRIHGLPADHVPTLETAIDFYTPESRPIIQAAVQRSIDSGEPWDLELRLVTATGRAVWVRAIGEVESEDGKPVRIVGALQDIDGRKRADIAVAQKERLLRTVTDQLSVLVMYVDPQETVRFLNATGAAWFGVAREAALDRPVAEIVSARHYEVAHGALRQALAGERAEFELQSERGGSVHHLQATCSPDRQDDGRVAGVFIMVTDVTATKDAQRRLESLARVDTLTGLPNRRQFDEKLEEALRRCPRTGRGLAVMFLDIDHFKSINDTLGPAGGDSVLKEFAARLRGAVRETDVVARLAGDAFVVLLEGLTTDADAALVARKIVEAIRVDFQIDGAALQVTTSLGVAVAGPLPSGPAPSSGELMESADRALDAAKREGRDGFRVSTLVGLDMAA